MIIRLLALACALQCGLCGLSEPMPGAVQTNGRDGAAMVWIPSGEFLMGLGTDNAASLLKERPDYKAFWLKDEQPQHRVQVDGFWMYKYEVTVGQYRKFCRATQRQMPKLMPWAKDNFPMIDVTWFDAAAYAEWAGGRLPYEAEWERAARGDENRLFPWGNRWDVELCNNYADTQAAGGGLQGKQAAPGGSYPKSASPYGVQDMAGNVWEWCQDWYDPAYYAHSPAVNPHGPETGELRVLRGGSWGSSSRSIRSTARHADAPDLAYHDDGGFRCVVPAKAIDPATALETEPAEPEYDPLF